MEITKGKLPGAQKILIFGPEGIGKSTFASNFPEALFIDTEGSTKHLDVARLPKPTSWAMLMDEVKYVRDTPDICKTLVIDTLDWAERMCIDSVCAKSKKDGLESFSYGKGYVYVAEEFGRLLNLLEEVIDRGVNVLGTAHAKMRKFEQPDEMGAYDRWEMKLSKNVAPLAKEWSDALLFANYKVMVIAADDKGKKHKAQGGKRIMYTAHHPCWDAKNRLGLPEELPLDFSALAQYIGAGTAPSAPVTPPPAPSAPPPTPPAQTSAPAPSPDPAGMNAPTQPAPLPSPPPAPDPAPAPSPAPQEDTKPQDNAGALKALRDLMKANGVDDYQVQAAFAARGYFPEQTPLENLPADFIQGVLIGAWAQVYSWIKSHDPVPF